MPPEQPPISAPPQPQVPTPIQPTGSWKKFALFALILLAAGAVSAYGLYLYQPVEQAAPIINIATSTWQTYRNEEYGFEFKYPNDWKRETPGCCNNALLVLFKEYEQIADRQPHNFNGLCNITAGTSMYEREQNTETIKDWYNRELYVENDPSIISKKEVGFGTNGGMRILSQELAVVDAVYLPVLDNGILSIHLTCGDDIRNIGTEEFNQILSTFKFTR